MNKEFNKLKTEYIKEYDKIVDRNNERIRIFNKTYERAYHNSFMEDGELRTHSYNISIMYIKPAFNLSEYNDPNMVTMNVICDNTNAKQYGLSPWVHIKDIGSGNRWDTFKKSLKRRGLYPSIKESNTAFIKTRLVEIELELSKLKGESNES